MASRPVLYLDVDDTILSFPGDQTKAWWLAHPHGIAAPGAGDFLRWAVEHCEVRWLTAWCPSGAMMADHGVPRLAKLMGVDESLIAGIRNPRPWTRSKCEGIDWVEHEAGRPWIWLEDELPRDETEELRARRALNHYMYCNVSKHPDFLVVAWRTIARRFGFSTVGLALPSSTP